MKNKEQKMVDKVIKALDEKPAPKLTKKEDENLSKIWKKLSEKK